MTEREHTLLTFELPVRRELLKMTRERLSKKREARLYNALDDLIEVASRLILSAYSLTDGDVEQDNEDVPMVCMPERFERAIASITCRCNGLTEQLSQLSDITIAAQEDHNLMEQIIQRGIRRILEDNNDEDLLFIGSDEGIIYGPPINMLFSEIEDLTSRPEVRLVISGIQNSPSFEKAAKHVAAYFAASNPDRTTRTAVLLRTAMKCIIPCEEEE